ncbi:MAG TPA: HDIG domain-containing protein [Dehalococcoidia bacterium]|nr:HDIG domain-containing protein [Dehalococcoidia bacterium]
MTLISTQQGARPRGRTAVFVALLTLLLVAILFPILPSRLHAHEGDIASQTVRAPRDFSYNSDVLRRQQQDRARAAVPDAFSYNVNVKNDQLARLSDMLARINTTLANTSLSRPQMADAIGAQVTSLSADQRTAVVQFSPQEWKQVEDEATRLLGTVLEDAFAQADVPSRSASLTNRVSVGLTAVQGDVAVALVRGLVVPTERIDDAATKQARDQAAATVPPQPQHFAANQVLVREGDVIDAQKLESLQNAGLLTVRLRYSDLGAVALLALISSAALAAFLLAFHPAVLEATRRLLLLAVIVAGAVLLAKIYMPLVLPDGKRHFLAFAFPAAAVPMLVASLFDTGLAVAIAGVGALLVAFTALYLPDLSGIVGLTALQPLEMTAAFFFSGLAGVLVVNRAERFNRFLLAGVAVAAAVSAVLFGFWLLDTTHRPADVGWLLLAGGISGVSSSLLTVGTFVLLGTVFNVTTRLQLMELGQLNQPLLRRLQDEAPGTFHHSILVGNLGERAADLIGADALLVRVGCYYHDIGKLSRPGFFIENQLGGKNPHEQLDPLTSNQIIQEHVRYGAELARRHHLPERVRDFTQEHHGSRVVAYFYRKAAERDPEIDPAIFSYPGPRPRSRETAIAMLADSTEAVVRSSRDHSFETIDRLVEGVVAERLAEGQFDDCALTLRDLRTIANSFKATLRAIYHPRIEYPQPTEAEKRRLSRRAGAAADALAAEEPIVPSLATGTTAPRGEPLLGDEAAPWPVPVREDPPAAAAAHETAPAPPSPQPAAQPVEGERDGAAEPAGDDSALTADATPAVEHAEAAPAAGDDLPGAQRQRWEAADEEQERPAPAGRRAG